MAHREGKSGADEKVSVTTSVPEFGFAIPQTFLDGLPRPEAIREVLSRIEAGGFSSGWVLEQILGSIPSLEPLQMLSYAAAVTKRIRLGAAVVLSTLRSPVHLAKSLSTLDHLSNGRLMAGVGLGADTRWYGGYGISTERRVARFVEGIRLMKRLWTEGSLTFEGQFWRLEGAAMEPKPLQQPHIPLLFGGHHPAALKRAAVLGDGIVGAGGRSTEAFGNEVRIVQRFLAEAGRDPRRFLIGKRVYIAVDDDRNRAKAVLARWSQAFYGTPHLLDRVAVCGDASECEERLAEVIERGAQLVILNPVLDELVQLDRLANQVLPRLG